MNVRVGSGDHAPARGSMAIGGAEQEDKARPAMLAHEYAELVAPITAGAIEPLLAAVAPLPRLSLLDVACGPGGLLSVAAARGARCTGLDASADMLGVAGEGTGGARLVEGNAQALPFPDASFDALTCAFGFPDIHDPVGALREAARVLRPGGALAFAVWLSAADGLDALDVALHAAWAHGSGSRMIPMTCCFLAERTLARRVLAATGFGVPRFERLETTSRHRTIATATATLELAFPALAAAIDSQAPRARTAIRSAIERGLERRRRDGVIALRWPFAVVSVHRRAGEWEKPR